MLEPKVYCQLVDYSSNKVSIHSFRANPEFLEEKMHQIRKENPDKGVCLSWNTMCALRSIPLDMEQDGCRLSEGVLTMNEYASKWYQSAESEL